MEYLKKSAPSAAKSCRGLSLKLALGALLSCSVIAGSAWGLASTFGAMQRASRTLSEGGLDLKIALVDNRSPAVIPKAVKSSRYLRISDDDVKGIQLSADAIQTAHQRRVAVEVAAAEKRKKEDEAKLLAFASPAPAPAASAAISVPPVVNGGTKPAVVTALVEDVPAGDLQPFNLVLADPEAEETVALPGDVPLPATRPVDPTVAIRPKPAEDRPSGSRKPSIADEAPFEKPRQTLFGALFGGKTNNSEWLGNDTKVAIYDVSNATVYLPDGTKLRAHSGIGHMRDNPRYEHVKMTGPTPAGIYRLSMREKRFYGVEAIRMTSIDGRDPKNRTGLLTHTNLLRGQIGSHGCVAFQNYQPFLNAFKRGQIKTMVVVPELPSSRTQLAALYRKAGA